MNKIVYKVKRNKPESRTFLTTEDRERAFETAASIMQVTGCKDIIIEAEIEE